MGAGSVIRGTNYLVNEAEIIGNWFSLNSTYGTYDSTIVEAELSQLASAGCTYIRLFQSYWCWQINRSEHETNLADLATRCIAKGIKIHLILFEYVGNITQWDSPDELSHPIMDWLSASGTQSWDPSAASNAYLANGSTGLFDLEKDVLDTAAAAASTIPGYRVGGTWARAPGGFFTLVTPCEDYTYPDEPSGDLGTLWQSFKDYITNTITACGAALYSVDIGNECNATYNERESIVNNATLVAEYITNGDVIDYRVDDSGSKAQAIKRQSYFFKWFADYVWDQHPGIYVTMGLTERASGLFEIVLAGDFYGGVNVSYDWYDHHLYSTGPGMAAAVAQYDAVIQGWDTYFPGETAPDQVVSEFFRHTHGANLNAAQNAYSIAARSDAGGFIWGYFETHSAFPVTATFITNWAPSAAGAYDFYPETGLVHSHIEGGVHKIEVRSTAAEAFIQDWFAGASLTEPDLLTPNLDSFLEAADAEEHPVFHLENQNGVLFAPGSGTKTNWRWMVGTAAEVATATVIYPGIGQALHTANQQTISGEFGWRNLVPVDPDTDMVDGQVLAVQAWYGDDDYAVDSFYDQVIQRTEIAHYTRVTLQAAKAGMESAMTAGALWIEVKKSYDEQGLIELTGVRDPAQTSISDARGERACQSVINMWPMYAQETYDSTDSLHVEVAKEAVIAMLYRRGGTSQTIANTKWENVFGEGGLISMLRKTNARSRQAPSTNSGLTHKRENATGGNKRPWASAEALPDGILPNRQASN